MFFQGTGQEKEISRKEPKELPKPDPQSEVRTVSYKGSPVKVEYDPLMGKKRSDKDIKN